MNYIVISETEYFLDGAKKITAEARKQKKDCKIIEIEDLIKEKVKLKPYSMVYF